jgi:hypothetical protein
MGRKNHACKGRVSEPPARKTRQDDQARRKNQLEHQVMGFPEQSANSKFLASSTSIGWQWACLREETVAATGVQFDGKDGGLC